jgi:uncharacterized protein (DUF433 family)
MGANIVAMTSVLDRVMFSEAEAARLLGVAQGTLHYWLDGGKRRGKTYPPVIRSEPGGAREVTWAEFVEAGFLREYRQDLQVPMLELRTFIEQLRERFAIPYPLAHATPFVAGRQLVWEVQESAGLDAEFCLVSEARGQLMLTPASDAFYRRVTWDTREQVAVEWRPASHPRSPVRINPEIRYGKPSVRGVSTEVLWEHADEGEAVEEIAEAFELTVADVRWAISYESARLAA